MSRELADTSIEALEEHLDTLRVELRLALGEVARLRAKVTELQEGQTRLLLENRDLRNATAAEK